MITVWKTVPYSTDVEAKNTTKVTAKTVTLAPGESYSASREVRSPRVSDRSQYHDTEREALEHLWSRENSAWNTHRNKAAEHAAAAESLRQRIARLK